MLEFPRATTGGVGDVDFGRTAQLPYDYPEASQLQLAKHIETKELVQTFMNMFHATKEIEYLDNVIGLVDTLVGVYGDQTDILHLRIVATMRYDQTHELKHLDRCIELGELAVAIAPLEQASRAETLRLLGTHYYDRHELLGDLDDLERAIGRGAESIAERPIDHPDRLASLYSLARSLCISFNSLGTLDDLQQAIELYEEVVTATLVDHPDRMHRLDGLASSYATRYQHLGSPEDLHQAIELGTKAVAAYDTGDPVRQYGLGNLGGFLLRRYDLLGAIEDLQQAIELGQEALGMTAVSHHYRQARLVNQSVLLMTRYMRLGTQGDRQQAIKLAEEAMLGTQVGHPGRPGCLHQLAIMFLIRYNHLQALKDLHHAVKMCKEAVAATPVGNPDRVIFLTTLGVLRMNSWHRLPGSLEDLKEAIEINREALEATPVGQPDRLTRLGNLANCFHRLYLYSQSMEDLQQAIDLSEEEVAAATADNPIRPSWLSNLSCFIRSRYLRLGTLEILDEATKRAEEALAATPADYPELADILQELATCISWRFNKTKSTEDIKRALELSRQAWNSTISSPQSRIAGAEMAARLLAHLHRWDESSSLLGEAVRMLPRLSRKSLERGDQEHQLSRYSGLAALAASTAFKAGLAASHSLTLLELGRGIIMGLVIDCRSEISELQAKDPGLFNKFHCLRIEVDSPPRTEDYLALARGEKRLDDRTSYVQSHHRREDLVHELEETLADIRRLPGFEGFLLPPPSELLMAMAAEGPIVLFNSTKISSDAIIIRESIIKVLNLPSLIYQEAKNRMQSSRTFVRGKRSTYASRNGKMEEFLLWLWDVAVGPVLDDLQLTKAVGGLARVWWIGVGILSTAPFHAAGDHSPGSTRNTISRAISSYIPTIRALSYARERKLKIFNSHDSRLLLVTMPTTPTKKPLTNAVQEAKEILDAVGERTNSTILHSPSVDQVLDKLQSNHIIHFACHGVSDPEHPSNSHVLLRKDDGSRSGALDLLTVETIAKTNIKNAQLAYLSACCTADNTSVKLADESIHIASAFHLAGFSHVLATLWESNDAACRQVARDFYGRLFSREGDSEDEGHWRVSSAFHHAVKKLRDHEDNWRQPLLWASFIHTGA